MPRRYAEARNRVFHKRQSGRDGIGWGCVSDVDSNARTIFVVDPHRGDGKPFVVHADEKLTRFRGWQRTLPGSG
jgi:hypothetical protein